MGIENLLAITPFPALSVVVLAVLLIAVLLSAWEMQVTESGGNWRVVNDLDHLDGLFT